MTSDDSPGDLESITTEADEDTTHTRQTSTETERTPTRHTPSKYTLAAAVVGIGLALTLVGITSAWDTATVVPAAVATAVAFWLGVQLGARQEATA